MIRRIVGVLMPLRALCELHLIVALASWVLATGTIELAKPSPGLQTELARAGAPERIITE
jgi:hypothetical protein